MTQGYRLDRYVVLPGERCVRADDGSEAALGSRAFDLLLALIEQRERVVTKDELLQRVWPGVVVEENNLTVHVSALRKVLGAQAVRTVSGRGYQLGVPIEPLPGPVAETVSAAPIATAPAEAAAEKVAPALPLPDKPSLAVLPFANLSGDPDQQYFSDGITEDVITELARFNELFVISRASSFTYKGRAVDMRTVGRELGVRYVLEGSIRRDGARVRVAARLVEAAAERQLWAERYDREIADVFALQEELTQAIVAAMAPQIDVAERARAARPGNLTAYDLAMRANALMFQIWADPTASAARQQCLQLTKEALALDPGCAAAWRVRADALLYFCIAAADVPEAEALAEAGEACRRAITLDAADHRAHAYLGLLALISHDGELALRELQRAYELNPNDVLTLSALGHAHAVTGNAEDGIELGQRAIRLGPRNPELGNYFKNVAWSYALGQRYEEGVRWAQQAILSFPMLPTAHYCLIVCHVGLGEIKQARAVYEKLNAIAPGFVAARLAGHGTTIVKPELRRRAVTFLRIAAGLEPPEAAESVR